MKTKELTQALAVAVQSAQAAGNVMRKNFRSVKKVSEESQHDIKLELDVKCQKLIEKTLRAKFPAIAILGEEGILGDSNGDLRWVVDPIDGTVNFSYGIPHCCVSIALQKKISATPKNKKGEEYQTIVGVVYDPFCDEMWTAIRGQPAKLNGIKILVSKRAKLEQSIVSIGFAKSKETTEKTLPYFNRLLPRIRKVRLMGAAALALTYVASGRFDAYIESGIRLWDIAAGGLILECAGGEFWNEKTDDNHGYRIIANNGLLRKQLEKV